MAAILAANLELGVPEETEYMTAETIVDLYNVPKHFDGGDIDDNGHWRGAEMCCLECRETTAMHCGITSTYLLASLNCGECGESFAKYWV